MFIPLKKWPDVSKDPADIAKLYGRSPLGLDLEWGRDEKPSVLGLSDGVTNVSVSYSAGKPYLVELLQRHPQTVFVGHNVVSSDLFVLDAEGIHLSIDNIEDTIIRHWLTNMHLCKATNKSALEEGEGERRGRGFMNLGTMCSIYTSLPFWKDCRGEVCEGPCPVHDVFGYNGTDSLGPVLALPQLKKTMILRGIEHLYPMHRKLAYILADMSRHGVSVDLPYLSTLRGDFESAKGILYAQLEAKGLNPRSPKQIKEFFAAKGIDLEDGQEQTIRDAVEDSSDPDLALLLDYKELGNGPDRWFAPIAVDKNGWTTGFLHPDGRIHPHIGYYTSSARLMCSGPNLQNVAKRRIDRKTGENIGKRIRRAIVAPEGYYFVRADYSNAENRVFLKLAGYDIPNGIDLHQWVVEIAGITEDMPFAIALGNAREAAKSIQHAGNYMEGLQLKAVSDLRKPRIVEEIKAGARVVYPNWTFKGKVVTFTGVNLARRAFGEATFENRRKALEIAEKYFTKFPLVRALQQKITKQIETEKIVRPPHGYTLLSYGYDEDRMKTAAAVWGSQPVAHFSKLALIDLHDKYVAGRPMYPILQIHDEIITEVPLSVDPQEAGMWLKKSMELETPEMPGFFIPADVSHGPNWKDQTKLKF